MHIWLVYCGHMTPGCQKHPKNTVIVHELLVRLLSPASLPCSRRLSKCLKPRGAGLCENFQGWGKISIRHTFF